MAKRIFLKRFSREQRKRLKVLRLRIKDMAHAINDHKDDYIVIDDSTVVLNGGCPFVQEIKVRDTTTKEEIVFSGWSHGIHVRGYNGSSAISRYDLLLPWKKKPKFETLEGEPTFPPIARIEETVEKVITALVH